MTRTPYPECATCHKQKGRPASVDPRVAINCPVLERLGRWVWPCHGSLAEMSE